MDWLKKKKEEAKQAASAAAAKIQNKRTSAFKGEGNVLGGGSGSSNSNSNSISSSNSISGDGGSSSATRPTSAPSGVSAASSASSSRVFKVPGFGKTPSEPAPASLSEDEKRQRREAQLKALDERTNAWDKRVATARKARLQQEAEREAAFGDLHATAGDPAATTAATSASSAAASRAAANGPAPRVLSADEMRAFELERAQAHVGFNPYAAVISSSSEASSVMQAIGGAASGASGSLSPSPSLPVSVPPPAPSAVASVRLSQPSASSASSVPSSSSLSSSPSPSSSPEPQAAATTARDASVLGAQPTDASRSATLSAYDSSSHSGSGGGVYVLLRQEPARAIAAAETIIKMLRNVLKSPQDDKFRTIRVANAAVQSKVVAVSGAVDLLAEAGFAPLEIDSEQFLVLAADAFDAARVQAVLDRTEVALIQLQVDSAAI